MSKLEYHRIGTSSLPQYIQGTMHQSLENPGTVIGTLLWTNWLKELKKKNGLLKHEIKRI
jgi:hypothetical protein